MNEAKRCCVDCRATKTPMWRSGPLGPRSLCNACGIRYRKRKTMADENPNSSEIRRGQKPSSTSSCTSSSSNNRADDQGNESVKMGFKFNHLGNDMIIQRSRPTSSSSSSSSSKLRRGKSKRKLGEVEEAAVLLMSLSCGSVFA